MPDIRDLGRKRRGIAGRIGTSMRVSPKPYWPGIENEESSARDSPALPKGEVTTTNQEAREDGVEKQSQPPSEIELPATNRLKDPPLVAVTETPENQEHSSSFAAKDAVESFAPRRHDAYRRSRKKRPASSPVQGVQVGPKSSGYDSAFRKDNATKKQKLQGDCLESGPENQVEVIQKWMQLIPQIEQALGGLVQTFLKTSTPQAAGKSSTEGTAPVFITTEKTVPEAPTLRFPTSAETLRLEELDGGTSKSERIVQQLFELQQGQQQAIDELKSALASSQKSNEQLAMLLDTQATEATTLLREQVKELEQRLMGTESKHKDELQRIVDQHVKEKKDLEEHYASIIALETKLRETMEEQHEAIKVSYRVRIQEGLGAVARRDKEIKEKGLYIRQLEQDKIRLMNLTRNSGGHVSQGGSARLPSRQEGAATLLRHKAMHPLASAQPRL